MGPSNADSHGNAEVQETVREEDGAQAMTAAKELHFQCKQMVSCQITEANKF